MHRRRVDLAGNAGNLLVGGPAGHQQPAIQVVAQLPQCVAQKLQAPARRFLQPWVDDEAGEHVLVLGRGKQGGMITQSQVAAKPQERGHYWTLRLSRQMWVDNTVVKAHHSG